MVWRTVSACCTTDKSAERTGRLAILSSIWSMVLVFATALVVGTLVRCSRTSESVMVTGTVCWERCNCNLLPEVGNS